MALEDNIIALTEAINGLTAALNSNTQAALGNQPAEESLEQVVERVAKTEAAQGKKPPTLTPAAKTPTPAPSAKTAEVLPTTASAPATTTEPTDDGAEALALSKSLREAFVALVNKDRAAAEGVLTSLGFPKLALVPANKHAEALALVQGALNG